MVSAVSKQSWITKFAVEGTVTSELGLPNEDDALMMSLNELM